MPIRIVAVGRKHESWVSDGIVQYEKRLKKPFDTEWVLLAHAVSEGLSARQDESGRILSRLDPKSYVILLDEKGKEFTSPAVSSLLLTQLEASRLVTIIIGGAYGVDQSVHDRADLVWYLSPLVFPHQMVRLILAEQLYRAQEIGSGGPYHHE
jgi:23S rRNA (pseudouridine1915-N3)-methyltransferase